MTEFKNIFIKLRNERQLTQELVAKSLGVSKSTIGMWETGKRLPSTELYEQIADYFNVDMDYLFGRSDVRQRIHFDNDGNAMYLLLKDEEELLSTYRKLNEYGKEKARETVSDMSELEKYTSLEESSISDAG